MVQQEVSILNEEGMHARPAGVFVQVANQFKSKIDVSVKGTQKNGKSIMGLMSLGLQHQDNLLIMAQGEDEAKALAALVELVKNKFLM